jgi:adenylate kinase
MRTFVLLGAPGSGKGTAAEKLKILFDIPHISTGDILRSEVKAKTDLGLKVSSLLQTGELVGDDIILDLVRKRLSKDDTKSGFIFDGFPRTLKQAQELDEILEEKKIKLNTVLYLNVPETELLKRITGRRVCSCGMVYHILFKPSKIKDSCDECSGKLIQRKDDTEEVVKERLRIYNDLTRPLVDYYKKKNILCEIDASLPAKQMVQQIEGVCS